MVEVGDSSDNFSSHWLLHQFIIYLDVYMVHKCMHMKFGMILYRKGADILATLSALHSLQICTGLNLMSNSNNLIQREQ